jgi:hypothetical protein
MPIKAPWPTPKLTVPPENSASAKLTVPRENSASAKLTVPPENSEAPNVGPCDQDLANVGQRIFSLHGFLIMACSPS